MGQTHPCTRQSQAGERSRQELTHELASLFAIKCFSSLELYSLKHVFKSLADSESHVQYLREDAITRYLEIPDVLGVSPVVYRMLSYIGAFPFLDSAPAILGLDQIVMVTTLLTDRYTRILLMDAKHKQKLLFKSLAVYDRAWTGYQERPASPHASSAALDARDDGGEEDDLARASFGLLGYHPVPHMVDRVARLHEIMIPADNFHKLVMLLFLLSPLDAQESLSQHAVQRLVGPELQRLRSTAEYVVAAFINPEESPGISYDRFHTIMPVCFPFLFNGLSPLFEHFLFSHDLDFSQRSGPQSKPMEQTTVPHESNQPLLPLGSTSIMDVTLLCQLSSFISGASLFRRLRLLYSGDADGFSMGSFETQVFNWRAPTILLVQGVRMTREASSGQAALAAAAFTNSLPQKRFPTGSPLTVDERVIFGVYVSDPWRHTHRECFGGEDTTLFQLSPVHDVFPASSVNTEYITFLKPSSSTTHSGISCGCPLPPPSQTARHSTTRPLGSVSLALDSSFEFGCFTHDYTSASGAFRTSVTRPFDFQEFFEVEALEVWGCGGDAEAAIQAERWAWEAREAEARRRLNLGTGDASADRALLEMAGMIGANRSGGSMG